MINIVINIVLRLILNQATMPEDKSLYDSDLIKFDSISRKISCTLKIDPLNFEVWSKATVAACDCVTWRRRVSGPIPT